MGNERLSFRSCAVTTVKSLSHQIPALGLRFRAGVVFVPQLGLPICCRGHWAYTGWRLWPVFHPQGSWVWSCKPLLSLLCLLSILTYFTAVLPIFVGLQCSSSLLLHCIWFLLLSRLLFTEPNGENFYSSATLTLCPWHQDLNLMLFTYMSAF
jgi:hypothetical protein